MVEKAGGIVSTGTDDVTNDVQNPLTKAALSVATGASDSHTLYEDNDSTSEPDQNTDTTIRSPPTVSGSRHPQLGRHQAHADGHAPPPQRPRAGVLRYR